MLGDIRPWQSKVSIKSDWVATRMGYLLQDSTLTAMLSSIRARLLQAASMEKLKSKRLIRVGM